MLLARAMADTTLPWRSKGKLGQTLRSMATELVPYQRHKWQNTYMSHADATLSFDASNSLTEIEDIGTHIASKLILKSNKKMEDIEAALNQERVSELLFLIEIEESSIR